MKEFIGNINVWRLDINRIIMRADTFSQLPPIELIPRNENEGIHRLIESDLYWSLERWGSLNE